MSEGSSLKGAIGKFFLLVFGIAAAIVLVVVVFAVWGNFMLKADSAKSQPAVLRQQKQPSVVKQEAGAKPANDENLVYNLRDAEKIGDTMLVRLGVARSPKLSGLSSGYSGNYYGTANYLFINMLDGKSHWLWDGTRHFVAREYSLLVKSEDLTQNTKPEKAGVLISYANADSNKNGGLDAEDTQTLAVIKDGNGATDVLKDVSRVNDVTATGDERVMLMYEKETKTFSRFFTIADSSLSPESEVPQVTLP